jgi:hypothetical protein
MRQTRDDKQILHEFRAIQNRQYLAIGLTLLLLLLLTLLYSRFDLFGIFSKNIIFTGQMIVIAAFIIFSFMNWRCPSCRKYLGNDIGRQVCKRCSTRLR